MEPRLKNKDEVLVSSVPFIFSSPKIGDMIAFYFSNKLLIKKIKKIRSPLFLVEGENLKDSIRVGWISKKDIIGKVIYKL